MSSEVNTRQREQSCMHCRQHNYSNNQPYLHFLSCQLRHGLLSLELKDLHRCFCLGMGFRPCSWFGILRQLVSCGLLQ